MKTLTITKKNTEIKIDFLGHSRTDWSSVSVFEISVNGIKDRFLAQQVEINHDRNVPVIYLTAGNSVAVYLNKTLGGMDDKKAANTCLQITLTQAEFDLLKTTANQAKAEFVNGTNAPTVLAQQLEAKAALQAKFDLAKSTGKPVEISNYAVDCNSPEHSCPCDIIHVYAQPDGSTKETRVHSH